MAQSRSRLAGLVVLSPVRILWSIALTASFLLSVFAAFRGAYIGPDYYTHFARLTEWPKIFDFSATSPPIYYLFGHVLFLLIGSSNAFPITLSIVQAGANTLAMLCFFLYTERRFNSALIHLGLVFFLAFLPVRIIHETTIGTDSTTIVLFVLLLVLFDRLLSEEVCTLKNAGLLGLGLALAVWTKYSFMALIPAIFLLLVGMWTQRRWKLERFVAICALSLIWQADVYTATIRKSIGWLKGSRLRWITTTFCPSKPMMSGFSALPNTSSAISWQRTDTAIWHWCISASLPTQ